MINPNDIIAALGPPRVSQLCRSAERLTLRADGPGEAGTRWIERLALGGACLLVATAALLWIGPPGLPRPSDPRIGLAMSLPMLAAAWPLVRIALWGHGRETVFDPRRREFRQQRVSARGTAKVTLSMPLVEVKSLYIQRGGPGRRSWLIARRADGGQLRIGMGEPATLERLHAEIAASLAETMPLFPERRLRPRTGPAVAGAAILGLTGHDGASVRKRADPVRCASFSGWLHCSSSACNCNTRKEFSA